jgi:hypothetical protein
MPNLDHPKSTPKDTPSNSKLAYRMDLWQYIPEKHTRENSTADAWVYTKTNPRLKVLDRSWDTSEDNLIPWVSGAQLYFRGAFTLPNLLGIMLCIRE